MVPDPSSPHEVLGLELFPVLCLIPLHYSCLVAKWLKRWTADLEVGVTIHWTGLLDWTTGLNQNGIKCLLQLFSV